eukprot:m.23623 g.23623  ORF g.23623 m.23623 type:complete len:262 (-) comp7239_c0_seq2:257-1042(-)
MAGDERDRALQLARLAEQCGRYDDMAAAMEEVVGCQAALNSEERNLLSLAFKNVVGSKRVAWRALSALEQKMSDKGAEKKVELVQNYCKQVEAELIAACDTVIAASTTLQEHSAGDDEAVVFFHKMAGDYQRYKAEVLTGPLCQACAELACESYKAASAVASETLPPTNPIRLGLALNFSVFYYEILNSAEMACKLAKAAFDDAITELEHLEPDAYGECTLILQLLRDNLTLWTSADLQGGSRRCVCNHVLQHSRAWHGQD